MTLPLGHNPSVPEGSSDALAPAAQSSGVIAAAAPTAVSTTDAMLVEAHAPQLSPGDDSTGPREQFWRFAGASGVGTSHHATGTPCQDAHLVEVFRDGHGKEILLAVVSDGAGSASLSHLGSRLACEVMADCLRSWIQRGAPLGDVLRPDAVEWIQLVQTALTQRAAQEGVGVRELACTCLALAADETHAVALQVGDGAIVLDDGAGGYVPVFWPERGEFANQTIFLHEADAADHLQCEVVERTVRDIAVFTDGIQMVALHYETKSAPATFYKPLMDTMAAQPPGSSPVLDDALGQLLGRPAILNRTDDDRTLVLGVRR